MLAIPCNVPAQKECRTCSGYSALGYCAVYLMKCTPDVDDLEALHPFFSAQCLSPHSPYSPVPCLRVIPRPIPDLVLRHERSNAESEKRSPGYKKSSTYQKLTISSVSDSTPTGRHPRPLPELLLRVNSAYEIHSALNTK